MKKVNLHDTTDAQIWAEEWIKAIKKDGVALALHKGTMIGWFANAILAGYNKGVSVGILSSHPTRV